MRYLVECYLPAAGAGSASEPGAHVLAAARELERQGDDVRFLRSIYVPEDETYFLLFEARSAELAGEAAIRAGITFERVLEAREDER